MVTKVIRFIRLLLSLRAIVRASETSARALGQAKHVPEGWLVPLATRQEAVSQLAAIHQYIYHGYKTPVIRKD